MTRENKVALVVGFGLVLLVGILISDHLASARSAQPPDLVPARDQRDAPAPDLRLVDLGGRHETSLPPEPPAQGAAALPAEPSSQKMAETRADAAGVSPALPPQDPDRIYPTVQSPTPKDPVHPPTGDKLHLVEPGETLAQISRRYYDTESLAAALARYNGMPDPDHVIAGRSLRVPPVKALDGSIAESSGRPGTSAKTYTVKPNETLSEIAQRLLGSARRWQELFELNRSVLSDPDEIRAGMELRLP